MRILRAFRSRENAPAKSRPGVASGTDTSPETDFLAQANALAHAGQHTNAVVVLEAGLERHPRYMPAHETLIQVLVHLQQYEQALQACTVALEIDPASHTLHASLDAIHSALPGREPANPPFLAQTNALVHAGKYAEAATALEAGIKHYPRHMLAHETLIQILVHLQQYDQALQACTRALEIDPESNALRASLDVIHSTLLSRETESPPFLTQANTLVRDGKHAEAAIVLEAGIEHYPRHILAHEILIQVLVHLQQYELALQACTRALEIDAESKSLRASLAVILATLRDTQRPEDIIRILDRYVTARSQHFGVVVLRVEMLLKLKRFPEAAQACEIALKLDPDFLPALLEKIEKDPMALKELSGTVFAATGSFSDDYNRLVAENVADFLIHLMTAFYGKLGADPAAVPLVQGLVQFRQKLLPDAEEHRAYPTSTLISFEKAWRQYKAGNIAESLPLFEKIFGDPSARAKAVHNPYVKVAVIRSGEIVGRHHDTRGHVDKAIATYREIISLDHNSIIAARLLVLLARTGNLRAAADLAEEAILTRPNLYPRLLDSDYITALKNEITLH